MKKVSVIMAVYNAEKTVGEAIESILNQTYTNWQFVICDDCSTDNTFSIVSEYANKLPEKFIVIKNEVNSKLPYSLNQCLKFADGDYVARMDADDISMPTRFEKQVEYLDNHPEMSVVGTSMTRFDEEGDFGEILAYEKPDKYILRYACPFMHATIMMRKEAYDKIGGYTVAKRTVRGQDVDLWFKFYAAGLEGGTLLDFLYKVREDRNAFHRRKLKYDFYIMRTRIIGFKKLGFPWWWRFYAYRQIISHFIPQKLKIRRRNKYSKKHKEN